MKFLLIDCGSLKTPLIKECLEKCSVDVTTVKLDDAFSIDGFDGIVLSGSPILLTEENIEAFAQKINFIDTVNVPVLGICFGHQLIGCYFGATIYRGLPERSNNSIKLKNNTPIFKGFSAVEIFAEDHTEGINMPDEFEHIAGSDAYPIEGIQHVSKPIFGVQFHPEVSGENGMRLFRNFCEICEIKKGK